MGTISGNPEDSAVITLTSADDKTSSQGLEGRDVWELAPSSRNCRVFGSAPRDSLLAPGPLASWGYVALDLGYASVQSSVERSLSPPRPSVLLQPRGPS